MAWGWWTGSVSSPCLSARVNPVSEGETLISHGWGRRIRRWVMADAV